MTYEKLTCFDTFIAFHEFKTILSEIRVLVGTRKAKLLKRPSGNKRVNTAYWSGSRLDRLELCGNIFPMPGSRAFSMKFKDISAQLQLKTIF